MTLSGKRTMDTRNLVSALLIQQELLQELLRLGERETPALSDIRLEDMAEINTQKSDVFQRMEVHAGPLRETISASATVLGLSPDAALGDIAGELARMGDRNVLRLHEELNGIAGKVRQTLEINREVAERFAASVRSSLELLTRLVNQSNVYGATGSYQQRQVGSVMINREA